MNSSAPPRIVLLPGLHGTDELAAPLLSQIPREYRSLVVQYPKTGPQTYDALLDSVSRDIPREEPVILIGESFGGPHAIRCAASNPTNVCGVVLCASFIRSPGSSMLASLPIAMSFRAFGHSNWAIRTFLTNGDVDQSLTTLLRKVGQSLKPNLIASRLREALYVNCSADLSVYSGPLVYLRGIRDRLVRRGPLRQIQRIRPDVVVAEIDAPHLILQTKPDQAWCAISGAFRLEI